MQIFDGGAHAVDYNSFKDRPVVTIPGLFYTPVPDTGAPDHPVVEGDEEEVAPALVTASLPAGDAVGFLPTAGWWPARATVCAGVCRCLLRPPAPPTPTPVRRGAVTEGPGASTVPRKFIPARSRKASKPKRSVR
jgi:hypothetical protein